VTLITINLCILILYLVTIKARYRLYVNNVIQIVGDTFPDIILYILERKMSGIRCVVCGISKKHARGHGKFVDDATRKAISDIWGSRIRELHPVDDDMQDQNQQWTCIKHYLMIRDYLVQSTALQSGLISAPEDVSRVLAKLDKIKQVDFDCTETFSKFPCSFEHALACPCVCNVVRLCCACTYAVLSILNHRVL